jgi:hypothetical protein
MRASGDHVHRPYLVWAAGIMDQVPACIDPAAQTRYGRWTWSPDARMTQSVAGLSRFKKYRFPSMLTRSKVAVLLPSVELTTWREDAFASS